MLLTDEFEKLVPIHGSRRESIPQISISKNGVTFSASLVQDMGYPKRVITHLNERTKQLIIVAVPETAEDSRSFCRLGNKSRPPRFSSRAFLEKICKATDFDVSKYRYYVPPVKVENREAGVGFELGQAKKVEV